MSDLATLQIRVDANGAIRVVDQFGKSVEQAADKTKKLDGSTALLKQGMASLAGLAGIGSVALALNKLVQETSAAQAAQAQLSAVLRSTGGIAGQTADALNAHAAALQKVTTFGDDAITSAQALLLTFTQLRGPEFTQATAAVADMAVALGTDLRGAAMQVGKALNDPVQGIAALRRSGIQFSDAQERMIRQLVETNRLADAQRVILAELQVQFGGSAQAARNTLGGAITGLTNAFGDLFEATDKQAGPFITAIDGMTRALERLQAIREKMDAKRDGWLGAAQAAANPAAAPTGRPSVTGFTTTPTATDLPVAPTSGPGSVGYKPQASAALMRDIEAARRALAIAAFDAIRQEEILAQFRRDSSTQQLLATGQFNELIGEGGAEVINLGTVINKLPPAVDQLTESARVFQEQTQLALGRFGSDFLRNGIASLDRFWDSFAQLGADAIGNVFARSVMDSLGTDIGERLGRQVRDALGGVNAGLAGGVYAGILGTIVGALNRSDERAEAVAQAARSIAEFAARATPMADAERRLADLGRERDALARQAAGAAGYSGGDGTSAGIAAAARNTIAALEVGGLTNAERGIVNRLNTLLGELGKLDQAFANNARAVQEAIEAERALERQRQIANLTAFRDSLSLSAQSPLSNRAKLDEARRQYDLILGLARTGDASAVASLPETARTLLDASRAVFASGTRYAEEFARVQADTAALIDLIASRNATTQDPVKTAVDKVNDTITTTTDELLALQQAQLAVNQQGYTAVVQQLAEVVAAIETMETAVVRIIEETAV